MYVFFLIRNISKSGHEQGAQLAWRGRAFILLSPPPRSQQHIEPEGNGGVGPFSLALSRGGGLFRTYRLLTRRYSAHIMHQYHMGNIVQRVH